MSTAVISGRVDASVRDKAAPYLKLAGVSAGDVIKTVWKAIAETGQVPKSIEDTSLRKNALSDFFALCDSDESSPSWFASMTDEDMADILGSRDA